MRERDMKGEKGEYGERKRKGRKSDEKGGIDTKGCVEEDEGRKGRKKGNRKEYGTWEKER